MYGSIRTITLFQVKSMTDGCASDGRKRRINRAADRGSRPIRSGRCGVRSEGGAVRTVGPSYVCAGHLSSQYFAESPFRKVQAMYQLKSRSLTCLADPNRGPRRGRWCELDPSRLAPKRTYLVAPHCWVHFIGDTFSSHIVENWIKARFRRRSVPILRFAPRPVLHEADLNRQGCTDGGFVRPIRLLTLVVRGDACLQVTGG